MANKEHETIILENVLETPTYVPTAEEYEIELPELGYNAKVRIGKINWSKNDESPRISYSFGKVSESCLRTYKEEKAPFDESIEGMITPEVMGYGESNHFVLTFDFEDEEFPVQKAEDLAEEVIGDLDQYIHEIEKIVERMELVD